MASFRSKSNGIDTRVSKKLNTNKGINVSITPTIILEAFCLNLGKYPNFQRLSLEGVLHAPTFVCRVDIGDLEAHGLGSSEQDAKHNAALSMLKLLLQKRDEGFSNDYPACCDSYLETHRSVIG